MKSLAIFFLLSCPAIILSQSELRHSGLGNAVVPSLAQDSSGVIYAGTRTKGLFRSADAGLSWDSVKSDTMIYDINALLINEKETIFASGDRQGFYKSDDAGLTWTKIESSINNKRIMAIFESSDGALFLGSFGSGIYRSLDFGKTWSAANSGLHDFYIFSFAENSRGEIFAGSRRRQIFKSDNNGITWESVNSSLTRGAVLSLFSASNNIMFAGLDTADGLRSDNGGNSWYEISISGFETNEFASADGNSVFAATGIGVYKSDDSGFNFQPVDSIFQRFYSLLLTKTGFLLAGSFSKGVFRSVNPITSITDERLPGSESIKLFQNYPNPFGTKGYPQSESTIIQIEVNVKSVSAGEPIIVRVFDILGQEISTLLPATNNGSIHSVEFKPKNLPSGVYFYVLSLKGKSQVRKMIYLR